VVREHPFEKAGLGQAPFYAVAVRETLFKPHPDAPARAGGTCDYCGRPIMYTAIVQSADGHEFGVGLDCVRKVWADPHVPAQYRQEIDRLKDFVEEEKASLDRAKRKARREAQWEATRDRREEHERKLFEQLMQRAEDTLAADFAQEYAEMFIEALRRAKAPAGRLWVGGDVVRVYFPKNNYVTVEADGAIVLTHRGQLTFAFSKLSDEQRASFEAATRACEEALPETTERHEQRVFERAQGFWGAL